MIAIGFESFESIGAIDFEIIVAFKRSESQDGE